MLCGEPNGKKIQKRGDICICIAVQQTLAQHCKATTPREKKKKKKKPKSKKPKAWKSPNSGYQWGGIIGVGSKKYNLLSIQ